MAAQLGKKSIFDFYEQEKLIGSGAFGTAFLAKDKASGERCVVKTMPKDWSGPAEDGLDREFMIKLAITEIRSLAVLRHPNIALYRDFYEDANCFFIIMEFCDGGDLESKIQAKKGTGTRFDEREIFDIFIQMASALGYVHQRKVIHRDIKPANVFLTRDGTVKLGDFGICKHSKPCDPMTRTYAGTEGYMAPEVWNMEPYNYKCDIWSFGIVIHQMACLADPYPGDKMLERIKNMQRGVVKLLPSKYSASLQQVVRDLLEPDAKKRPDLVELLQRDYVVEARKKFQRKNQQKLCMVSLGHEMGIYTWNLGSSSWELVCNNKNNLFSDDNSTACAVSESIYVFCGNRSQIIHNETPTATESSWTAKNGPSVKRKRGSTVEYDGRIYMIGGLSEDMQSVSDSFLRFTPQSGKWDTLPAPPTPVCYAGFFALDGKFFLLGGKSKAGITAALQVFDEATRKWEIHQNGLDKAASNILPTVVNGVVYITIRDELFTYDPKSMKATKVADWPVPFHFGSMTSFNGKVVASSFYTICLFDPEKKCVEKLPSLPSNEWTFCLTILT